jgi:hypothetical protein
VIQQHSGQLLEEPEPLPAQLIHPTLEIVQHRAFVTVVPEPVHFLFQHIGLEELAVERKQRVEFLPFAGTQVDPAGLGTPTKPNAKSEMIPNGIPG